MKKIILFCISLSLLIVSLTMLEQKKTYFIEQPKKNIEIEEQPLRLPKITNECPSYLDYEEIIVQLKSWESQAVDFVKVLSYGKSSEGTDLYCAVVTNTKSKENKEKVLITACIHGNEPWSTGTVVAFMGYLLKNYETDKEIQKTLNTKEIYIVPVVSPDSYPSNRYVDGIDPNRNFPKDQNSKKQSIKPLRDLQKLFLDIKPKVAISGHTFGRSFLYPYADTNEVCENDEEYKAILKKMQELSGYSFLKTSKNYGYPIYGTEIDWYYRNGCFSLVVEFGTHQIKPTLEQIKNELNKTKSSLLYFINEGSKVVVKKSTRDENFEVEKSNALNVNLLETGP